SLQSSGGANVTGSSVTVTATPNGNGNNCGVTLYSNGNTTLPAVDCSAPGGSGGGGGGGGGGRVGSCTVSVTRAEEWNDRFNVTYSVSGTNSWVVRISPNG